jgi:hypothetical protein
MDDLENKKAQALVEQISRMKAKQARELKPLEDKLKLIQDTCQIHPILIKSLGALPDNAIQSCPNCGLDFSRVFADTCY